MGHSWRIPPWSRRSWHSTATNGTRDKFDLFCQQMPRCPSTEMSNNPPSLIIGGNARWSRRVVRWRSTASLIGAFCVASLIGAFCVASLWDGNKEDKKESKLILRWRKDFQFHRVCRLDLFLGVHVGIIDAIELTRRVHYVLKNNVLMISGTSSQSESHISKYMKN